MPLVDIHTIGAGGGSLAWLEAGGLRVGPQSAGADARPGLLRPRRHRADGDRREPVPRPARPGVFLGGRMQLDDEAAATALRSVRRRARPRRRRARRGDARDRQRQHGRRDAHDHRRAGHRPARLLARRLRRRRPDARRLARAGARDRRGRHPAGAPGTFSRLGDAADRHPRTTWRALLPPAGRARARRRRGGPRRAAGGGARSSSPRRASAPTPRRVRPLGRHALRRPGVHGQRRHRRRTSTSPRLADAFHDAHRVRYGHSTPGAPVEFVNLRARGVRRHRRRGGRFDAAGAASRPVAGTRAADFDGGATRRPSSTATGCGRAALSRARWSIEEQSSTTVVPPGHAVRVDALGNLLITTTDGMDERHDDHRRPTRSPRRSSATRSSPARRT